MKSIFLIAIAFTLAMPAAFSQSVELVGGIGVNASQGKYKGLNFVLNRYNQTRQGQSGAAKVQTAMGTINSLTGISWQLGLTVVDENLVFYTGVNRIGRAGSTFSKVTDINGSTGQRDVRFTANSVNLELGLGARNKRFMGILGGSLDFIKNKAYTKLNSNEYNKVMDEFNLGFTFFADINVFVSKNFALSVKPYWQAVLIDTDFTDLNRAINPATYYNDDYEDVSSSASNIGLQIQLRIFTSKD